MRRAAGLLFLVALLAAPVLFLGSPVPHARALPAFVELDEHGFEPFYSSYCRKAGHTSFETTNANLTAAGDGIVVKGSNGGCYAPQNEPTLAQSPTDPLNMVAGANDYRICCDSLGYNDGTGWAYVTKDGGVAWRPVLLPGLTTETGGAGRFSRVDSAGDPSVAFAPNGHDVYYANIVFSRSDLSLSGIAVSVSHDGGSSWARPHLVTWTEDGTVFNDKEWVTVGPDGRVAVTWTRFTAASYFSFTSPIVGSISSDGDTWSKLFAVTDDLHLANQGSQPFFAPDGSLVVVHEGIRYSDFNTGILVSTVRPGKNPVTRELGRVYDAAACLPRSQDDRGSLTDEQFRVSTMPSAAMDPTTGTIAVAWVDGERGCAQKHSDAQVKLQFVNGWHHSPVQTITHGGDKAFPALGYRDGKVVVSYFTRDFSTDPKHIGLDYAYSSSTDGFVEHRLSDGSSNPYMQFRGAFLGDYTALVLGPESGYAVWTDSRGGDQNIMGAAFTP